MSAEGGDHGSNGAIMAAFLANVGIAITKFVGFLLTGSSSLLAESIHSVADSANQGLLVLGGRSARRDPTTLHQFGYGRLRYFWAFIVAVVLFSVGGLFAIYEGYHKIADPREIDSPEIALGILGLAIVFEGFALRTAVKHAQPERRGRSWKRYIQESRSPELPVLLLEDSGALLGLVFAMLGVILATVTGNPIFDGIGTLAIGLLLVSIAAVLAAEMKSLLTGESASPDDQQAIERELASGPGVKRIIHVLTQHLGPDELLVAVKLEFEPRLTTHELVEAINACETRVRSATHVKRLRIYVEPDLGPSEAPREAAPVAPGAG